jgi:hypothetical protein
VVDDFVVGVIRFGRLDVQAHNDGGIWRLDKIELLNPRAGCPVADSGRSPRVTARNSTFTLE